MKFSKPAARAMLSRRLKQIGTACLMTTAVIPAIAADNSDVRLNVELKNGNTDKFYLAEQPELSFNNDECVIKCNGVDVSYDMADIVKSYFSIGDGAIEENLADGIKVDLTDSNTAVVSGLAQGTHVALYGLNGTMILAAQADADGTARISLSELTPGMVYVVSINSKRNFKLYKK